MYPVPTLFGVTPSCDGSRIILDACHTLHRRHPPLFRKERWIIPLTGFKVHEVTEVQGKTAISSKGQCNDLLQAMYGTKSIDPIKLPYG